MRFANSVLNGLSHKNVHINFHYFMLLIHFKDGLVFFLIKKGTRKEQTDILVKMILTVYTVCADLLLAVCSGFHLLSAVGHRGLNHLCLPPKLPKSGFSVETESPLTLFSPRSSIRMWPSSWLWSPSCTKISSSGWSARITTRTWNETNLVLNSRVWCFSADLMCIQTNEGIVPCVHRGHPQA